MPTSDQFEINKLYTKKISKCLRWGNIEEKIKRGKFVV